MQLHYSSYQPLIIERERESLKHWILFSSFTWLIPQEDLITDDHIHCHPHLEIDGSAICFALETRSGVCTKYEATQSESFT